MIPMLLVQKLHGNGYANMETVLVLATGMILIHCELPEVTSMETTVLKSTTF